MLAPVCRANNVNLSLSPFTSVLTHAGGLGDVMGALPKALARRGHRVMVVAPRYGEYAEGWETGVRRQMRVFGGDQQVTTLSFPKPQTSTQLSPPAAHTLLLSDYSQHNKGNNEHAAITTCGTCCAAIPCHGSPDSLDAAKAEASLLVVGMQSCPSLAPQGVISTMNLCACACMVSLVVRA